VASADLTDKVVPTWKKFVSVKFAAYLLGLAALVLIAIYSKSIEPESFQWVVIGIVMLVSIISGANVLNTQSAMKTARAVADVKGKAMSFAASLTNDRKPETGAPPPAEE
jgi:hypothetical protein